jgi:hypothetical protein
MGCADVGTVTWEGVARDVDGQIISGEIVQLVAVGIPGRDGSTAVSTHIDGRIQGHSVDALQPAGYSTEIYPTSSF